MNRFDDEIEISCEIEQGKEWVMLYGVFSSEEIFLLGNEEWDWNWIYESV